MKKYEEMLQLLAESNVDYSAISSSLIRHRLHKSSYVDVFTKLAREEAAGLVDAGLSTFRLRYRELRGLKNTKENRTVLLLGNGPSVSMIDWYAIEKNYSDIEFATVNFFRYPPLNLRHRVRSIIFSDPITLEDKKQIRPDLNQSRLQIMKDLKTVEEATIFVPRFIRRQVSSLDKEIIGKKQIAVFSDSRSRLLGRLSPIWPRGYVSMTLMKAIAVLTYLGYSRILLIGADNDYSSSMRIMPDNTVAHIDAHAGSNKRLVPQSHYTHSLYIESLLQLQMSWDRFSSLPVCNLDPLSHVTSFKKVTSKSDYFGLLECGYQQKIRKLEEYLTQ